MSSSTNNQLPPKEASMYKKILKFFKDKHYKNGLKNCNTILKEFPQHGETLAMKGLILNSLGKREQAFEFVRRGVKNDVGSYVCWHVFGLVQKADHKYDEAIKCYRFALRLKKDSVSILSDLSLAQIQTRDLEGYRDSRFQLFKLRPHERSTWIGCAMAYHLNGENDTAVKILAEYLSTNNATGNFRKGGRRHNETFEHSEFLLYYISILMESSRYSDALEMMDKHHEDIVDRVTFNEFKAQIFLALGRNKEAEKIVLEELFKTNSENKYYCELLQKTRSIEDEASKLSMFDELAKLYPRSMTIQHLPLTFISDCDGFKQRMSLYLQTGLRKGRPALFRGFKYLYNKELKSTGVLSGYKVHKLSLAKLPANFTKNDIVDLIEKSRSFKLTGKLAIVEELLLNWMDSLRSNCSFDASADKDSENLTCILWVYYFLAQHFDALKQFSLALFFANTALEHTPTLIDIFVIKAKIFKHAGFPEKAAKCLEEAQSLDTSDRYLNSKCAKYLLRINKIQEANDMCAKFTREGLPASENLNEMQCMWFLTETAAAYQRLGMYGEALKKCIEIDNHFAEIADDQFDFNTYCMLKVTLRSYVQMIRLEDQLKSHRFFLRMAKTATEVYLRLNDETNINKKDQGDANDSGMSASELKKMRNKLRKAQLKAEQNPYKNKKAAEKKDPEKSEFAEVVDIEKLEKSEAPLDDVNRFLVPLKLFGKDCLKTHLLAYEVYCRKKKILLQFQSLKRAFRLCPQNSDSAAYWSLIRQCSLFLSQLSSEKEQYDEAKINVLKLELLSLPVFAGFAKGANGDEFFAKQLPSVEQFIEQNFSQTTMNFLQRVEYIRTKHQLASPPKVKQAGREPVEVRASKFTESALKSLVDDCDKLQFLTLNGALDLIDAVEHQEFGSVPTELLTSLKHKFHEMYPFTSKFMTANEQMALEMELSPSDHYTSEPEEYTSNPVNVEVY